MQLILTPPIVSIFTGGDTTFRVHAQWSDGTDTPPNVTFAATGGTISQAGAYKAGAVTGAYEVIARDPVSGRADTSAVAISSTPLDPFSVTITDFARITGTRITVPDGVRVECAYSITAVGSGGQAADFATWVDGRGTWIHSVRGVDASFDLTSDDLVSYFGSDRILSNQPVTATRLSFWDASFQIRYSLRYRLPTGEVKSHSFILVCD